VSPQLLAVWEVLSYQRRSPERATRRAHYNYLIAPEVEPDCVRALGISGAAENFAFVVENNQIILRCALVLDVSNPANPESRASRDQSAEGSWLPTKPSSCCHEHFLHQGYPTGLKIIDITDRPRPRSTEFDPQKLLQSLRSGWRHAGRHQRARIEIYSVSDPANIISRAGKLPDGLITADQIALNQNLAYLMTTAGRNRLQSCVCWTWQSTETAQWRRTWSGGP
jgi:hypothetical protein